MGYFKSLWQWARAGIVAAASVIVWLAFAMFRSKQEAAAKASAKAEKEAADERIDGLKTNEEHRKELLR